MSNLREAAEAIRDAEREFDAGLVYSPGHAATQTLAERAAQLPELGAARVLIHDPSGSLHPRKAAELVEAVREACGLPVGLYCQGSGGAALASAYEASRAGADLVATALYPIALTLHRVSGESIAGALASPDLDTGVDIDALWRASEHRRRAHRRRARLADPAAHRHAGLRSTACRLASSRRSTRACARTAPATGSTRCWTSSCVFTSEAGSPPLAAPIGQILASQAVINVLSATRYQMVVDELRALLNGQFGSPPGTIDETVLRAVRLVGGEEPAVEPVVDLDEVRESAGGLAASEEELLLLALFGEAAEPLLRSIRGRGRRSDGEGAALDATRAERVREIVRLVQESGVGEITIEDGSTKVTVRRADERAPTAAPAPLPEPEHEVLTPAGPPAPNDVVRVEAPLVGTFYRAPDPDSAPFVQEGDVVVPGQTLCILEAMKTMNEIESNVEGRVRKILVENAQPVEYGQLLFELEPLDGRPPDPLVALRRVLVANRGEIAVRVIRAVHELGLEAVAVYSTADADAMHVRLADRAVRIGPPPAAQSYLSIPSVVAAATTTGCDAVHPGYGFLSENPAFVSACEDNDLVFVGPGADVMERMGDKVQAKAELRAAQVPVVPGTEDSTSLAEAKAAAAELGFPILLKARAGGGGKGMRLVEDGAELEGAFRTASAEAQAAFGDGGIYVEKALVPARHVEIQVLCDGRGGVLTLGERECSIQRRHQKLVEESPSPALTPETARGDGVGRRARLPLDRLPQRGHVRVPARAGRRVLLHRAERPAPGRAPGQRALYRARSRPGTAPGRRRRAARADRPGSAARPRDRVPDQRRGSVARLRAVAGQDRALQAAARPGSARRHGDRGRLGRPAVLRLAARQADRLVRDA